MATIKVKLKMPGTTDQEGIIYYQITHKRLTRRLPTQYKIRTNEWHKNRLVAPANNNERKTHIRTINEKINTDIRRLTKIERKLQTKNIDYSITDIIDEFNRYTRDYTLFNYMDNIIATLRRNGKIRTAETYKSTLNSFRTYRRDEDITLDSITTETMETYQAWLKNRGIVPNTTSFYMRILRATYNRAVDDEIIENTHPFRHVYTGVDKTLKRALPLAIIRKIKALDLSQIKKLDYARDMFMMSFYLRGMSFVDMAFLKRTDLKNGYITYRRRKTGQQLTIEWTKEMQKLHDKYPQNQNDYLLPIIRKTGVNELSAYRNAGYNINHNLKRIAAMTGIAIPLTLYVARHSWATAAKAQGIPLPVISEGLGHDNETTTQIYLAGLDTTVIDKANRLILRNL